MEKKKKFISEQFARNMVNGDIRMNSTYYFDALDKDAVKNVGEAFIDFKHEEISQKDLVAVAQNHNLDFNCFVYAKPKTLKAAEKAEQFGPTPKGVESCVFTSKEKGNIFVQVNRDIWELLAKDGNKKYQDLLERIDQRAARKIGKPYQGPTYMATPEREM